MATQLSWGSNMNIKEAFEKSQNNGDSPIRSGEFHGWLVIINNDLYLLDEALDEKDYKNTPKVKITEHSLVYFLRQAVLPLGGGESFLFHKARIVGNLNFSPMPMLGVDKLSVQERGSEK